MPGAAAQGPAVISGTVLRLGATDTLPAGGIRVVLHRLGRGAGAPIDSMHAGAGGGFRFRVEPDSVSVYLLSARWAGIEYFSDPIPGRLPESLDGIRILVSDTSSSAPVRVLARYLIVGAPDADRTRTVVDVFVLRNPGPATRVARDTLSPTWEHVLPGGTRGHSSGPSNEFSDATMRLEGDTVRLYSPIAPGADRHVMLQHTLAASVPTLRVPLGGGADSVQVVTEEEGLAVRGLPRVASQVIDGRPVARWAGSRAGLPPGDLVITFPRVTTLERRLVPALAGTTVLVLVAAAWLARRRRPLRPAPVPATEQLLERIARLDIAHRGRPLSETEQQAYRAERARLKEALNAALAGREPRR